MGKWLLRLVLGAGALVAGAAIVLAQHWSWPACSIAIQPGS